MIHNVKLPLETYYKDAPITIRLMQSNYSAFLIGVLIPLLTFLVGYKMGYLVGVLQPWYELRGWITIVFLALGLPILFIYYQNKKEV